MTNYNLGQNKMEQSTPSPKLRKKSSGPSKTIVWKTRGRMRCLWKRPEAKFCYCLLQMELFEKFKYHIINKKKILLNETNKYDVKNFADQGEKSSL